MLINLLRHAKFIASAACVISIIIDATAVSCTQTQIDLQALFVTTAALLCQRVVINKRCKSAAAQYKRRYYLAPTQSIITKQM